MSSLDREKFMLYYVRIFLVLAIISLICFTYTRVLPGMRLPFQTVTLYNDKLYIYTFYYTLGRWFIENRNCGIFWEPGGYQIFLNLALLILVTKPGLFAHSRFKREQMISIIIISITVFTTMSTTGYLCYLVVMGIGIMNSSRYKNKGFRTVVKLFAALLVFLIVELNLGIVQHKLIDKAGSYATRFNDTSVSFDIANQRFLTGYGFSNGYSPQLLANEGVTSNSNGIGSLAVTFGYPVLAVYLIYLYRRITLLFDLNLISSMLAILLFLLFYMSESVIIITLFLSFLYKWKDEQSLEQVEANGTTEDYYIRSHTVEGGYGYGAK